MVPLVDEVGAPRFRLLTVGEHRSEAVVGRYGISVTTTFGWLGS